MQQKCEDPEPSAEASHSAMPKASEADGGAKGRESLGKEKRVDGANDDAEKAEGQKNWREVQAKNMRVDDGHPKVCANAAPGHPRVEREVEGAVMNGVEAQPCEDRKGRDDECCDDEGGIAPSSTTR